MKKEHYLILIFVLMLILALLLINFTSAEGLKQISAKALDDHECNNNEWHFIITQVISEDDAPDFVLVSWEGVQETEQVGRSNFTGGIAYYTTTLNLDKPVTSATTEIRESWDGQFNLSYGPCLPGPEEAAYLIETNCWESGQVSATFTVNHVTLGILGPEGPFEIDKSGSTELIPGEYIYIAQADEGYTHVGAPQGQFTIEACPDSGEASYLIKTACWEPDRKNTEFTINRVTLSFMGPGESFEIDQSGSVELIPGEYTYTAKADEVYSLVGEPDGGFTIEECPVNGDMDEGFGGENFLKNAVLLAILTTIFAFLILIMIVPRHNQN